MSDENNMLRCHAHEIILKLHSEKEIGQIQILHMACSLAIKDLYPEAYRKLVSESYRNNGGGK